MPREFRVFRELRVVESVLVDADDIEEALSFDLSDASWKDEESEVIAMSVIKESTYRSNHLPQPLPAQAAPEVKPKKEK